MTNGTRPIEIWRRSAPRELQAVERAGAGAELVDLDSQALEHADVEIAQRRRALRIKRQVSTVFETAACKQDRQIPG